MKPAIILLIGLFAGCAGPRQTIGPPESPEAVSITQLPPLTSPSTANGLKLNVLFLVRKDGTVSDVKMLGSSGDTDWDMAAADSMRQWRFSVIPRDTSTSERWIRNTIVVQVQAPVLLALGELVATSKREADSLYALLEKGIVFSSLAKQIREGTTTEMGRYLGTTDISRYPRHVRDELRKLTVDGVTHPLRVGTSYVIYKRYDRDRRRDFPE